ncbi:hypothetical protein C1646_811275 [Rhizophagus diaphanus]|nr:hypothetical protein C1646_811275 [Rhizophagus diaphanus] [Rhizophagus sp. MUCL 43196]
MAIKITCPVLGASIGGSGGAYLGNVASTVLRENFMKDKHQNILKKQEKSITGTCGGFAIDVTEEVQLWNHGSRLEEIEKILGLKHKIIEWNSSFITRFNGYENIWRTDYEKSESDEETDEKIEEKSSEEEEDGEGEEHTSGNNIGNLNTIGISMDKRN